MTLLVYVLSTQFLFDSSTDLVRLYKCHAELWCEGLEDYLRSHNECRNMIVFQFLRTLIPMHLRILLEGNGNVMSVSIWWYLGVPLEYQVCGHLRNAVVLARTK